MYLLGFDIGSSSVKVALIDADSGKTVSSDFFPKKEAPIKALREGWAEQNPDDWWEYLKNALASVLSSSKIDVADIKAIGISYQMHGLVAIDKNRKPLRDAIIWCDSRGVPYGDDAFHKLGHDTCLSRILNSPGNFTASKLAWVKENEPEVFEKIDKVLLPGDYIAMRLTDEISTTVEGLSEYMLWDFTENAPAKFLLDYFGFDKGILPEIKPTFSQQGHLSASAAKELGLKPGTPVTYRAGDQPNNALSLNVFNPGEIASTAGTSGVIYGINDIIKSDSRSRVNNFAHVNHSSAQTRIGVMACINGTGILNSWLKRNVVPSGISYEDINRMAASVPVGAAGIKILPFGNGAERLLQNRQIGCSMQGLNFNIHSTSHILRAAQEGIVFAFMYGMEIMRSLGMTMNHIHAGKANMFLSPIFRETLASVSGATINLFDTDGAAGAAKGAGIGAGIYADNKEAFATLRKLEETLPASDQEPYLEAYDAWKNTLSLKLSEIY